MSLKRNKLRTIINVCKGQRIIYLIYLFYSELQVCMLILCIKGGTTSHLSVLTAVQYQHPQQWRDDKTSVLLMDSVNMVVVVKDFSCQPTVRCHILRGLFYKWNAIKGILEHYNLSLAGITPIWLFNQTNKQNAVSATLHATVTTTVAYMII